MNVHIVGNHDISDIIHYSLDLNVPRSYPLYKQCDPRWGSDLMVNNTVCRVGCLMSSVSMALAGHAVPINLTDTTAAHAAHGDVVTGFIDANPGTLNQWLRQNRGYTPNNDLIEAAVPKVAPPGRVIWPRDGMHVTNDIPIQTIQGWVATRVVIANVMHGHHFVLVVGVRGDGDTLIVNDPGFDRTTYSYSRDVVGWRIFDVVSL